MNLLTAITDFLRLKRAREREKQIEIQIAGFDSALQQMGDHYVTFEETDVMKAKWRETSLAIQHRRIRKRSPLYPVSRKFLNDYSHLSELTAASNAAFVRAESERCNALLSDIDGKSLDAQQRTVVLTEEARTLVLAGAGSGKTLTILGKVKYLCRERGVAPEDILLISYTRASADEMSQKLHHLGLQTKASTFHKLGLGILTNARKSVPRVENNMRGFIQTYFERHVVEKPGLVKNLMTFFAYYLRIPRNITDAKALEKAYEKEKKEEYRTLRSQYQSCLAQRAAAKEKQKRTLNDELVKSLEEVAIANFLFLNGVNYEYERYYPYDTGDTDRKRYQPDFYLPDYDIWLEHFGIDENGRLPWLSAEEEQKYRKGMEWKREIHAKYGTKLLETYSYWDNEGTLLEHLDGLLKENGVEYHEPDLKTIYKTVFGTKTTRYFSELINLCTTFLSLYKSKGLDMEDLKTQEKWAQTAFLRKRTSLFRSIMQPIIISYEESLHENGSVDFSDMINEAAKLVEKGFPVPRYRYVIIDEYQDISFARYRLIKAILNQTGAKLLCVGDDWQSIYRFAGSDISLFTQFGKYFGRARILRLEQTYRNAQQLIDEAGAFVMRNPDQMQKSLRSSRRLDYPITFLCYQKDPAPVLRLAMDKIIREFGSRHSILLLGRTNADREELLMSSGLFAESRGGRLIYLPSESTPVSFLTVHKAKGLEADNVILLNFQNAALGFPCQMTDDPLLNLVLTEPEKYPFAEERRLFYVALSRTRNRIFILTDRDHPSAFYREFSPSKSVCVYDPKSKAQTTCS